LGIKDTISLHKIYGKLQELENKNGWGFSFVVDDGTYETAIIFHQDEEHYYRKPKEKDTWKDLDELEVMICPDIVDFSNKIIIEYEEETGNRRSGAYLARKGHGHEGDLPSERDSRRNKFYSDNKFRFCRIWQSQLKSGDFVGRLFYFLQDCFWNRDTSSYQN